MRFSYILVAASLLLLNCKSKNSEGETAQANTSAEQKAMTPTNENIVSTDSIPKGPLPVMSFKESTYDFGKIKEGEKVKHTFEFTNTGEAPLVIQNASASCGCTVPQWPKDPIQVGKTGKIEVEFNSSGKTGPQNKTVSITANTNPTITTVNITGTIEGTGTGAEDHSGHAH